MVLRQKSDFDFSQILTKGSIILASVIDEKPDIFDSGDFDFHTDNVSKFINGVSTNLAIGIIS